MDLTAARNRSISLAKVLLLLSATYLLISIAIIAVISGIVETKAVKDLAENDAREASTLVFQTLSKRNDTNFCVVQMDIDNFRYVNDSYGYTAGDMVLKQLATYLQANTRSGDTLARIGPDEFAIILNTSTWTM